MTGMDTGFDAAMLSDAFAACSGCVREALDAAGVSLDCRPVADEAEVDTWRTR